MTKKYLALLFVFVTVAAAFSSCSGKTTPSSHKLVTETTTQFLADESNFKLSYSQSDSLDPFKAETLNNQIVDNLVFDSLFVLDENFSLQPSIATSYTYTDSKTITVLIPSGLVFSDGSELSAKHVVSSFNSAKESPHYKNSLKAIDSAKKVSDTAIEFKLKYANPNAHNLLTFEISKGKNDKNGYPIGSGRYKFSEGNGTVYIERNSEKEDFSPRLTKIILVNIPSEESMQNAINIGNISYAFRDLSDGSTMKMKCNKKAVNLSNLVFVGINGYSGITKNENIRRAISLAIDRDILVKSAYQGYAKSALSPFSPVSSLGKQTAVLSSGADISAAKQAISQSSYSDNKLKIDILVNDNEKRISCAKLIKQQLEAAGFKVTINKEKNKAYKSSLKNRNFDIYIGEIKVSNDFNLKPFFEKNGSASYGIDISSSKTAKAYTNYLSSKGEIGSFILDFSQEMPFIPLLYRQGMICYSKSMHGDMQGYYDNYFFNIEDWYFN